MENNQTKTPRKRMCNFTADEKALLAQLIKKNPIVESKYTDGKSVAKKQAAWDLISREFNCNANVHKRETITLKRAWDNMKAYTRKARATERGSLLRTGGGPPAPPPPPQHGAIITMVEEAAPSMICEIKNSYDSDGTIIDLIGSIQVPDNENPTPSVTLDTRDLLDTDKKDSESDLNITFENENYEINNFEIEDIQSTDAKPYSPAMTKTADQVRKPTDYIRREAVIRIKHLENKKKMEMQILKTQLEVEQIKKRTAFLEQQRQEMLLEKSKIELEEVKKSFNK